MKEPIDNYFTTGELAKLCKIPRKTLLYYDSLGLITPEVIEENGYRYYKRTQLFALELILTMRKLDIPLAEILITEILCLIVKYFLKNYSKR